MRLTGGEALVAALRPEAVRAVFGLAGGKLSPVFKALAREPGISYTGVRHESTAGFLAAAHFARHGEMAVALTELGSGTTNVIGAVTSAYNNRLPFLLISSNNQHACSYPPRGMFMEADLHALLRPVTKWNAVVHDARRIPELVQTAFREALSGRKGPVHLDVPQDILVREWEFADDAFAVAADAYRPTRPIAPNAADVARAAELLRTAERPLLIAGGGVAHADGAGAFRALATAVSAACITTQRGIGAVATNSADFIGHAGVIGGDAVLKALREADVVAAFGCRFSSWMWDQAGPLVRPPQKLIQIDTDPAVLGAATPVTVAMLADAKLAALELAAEFSNPAPQRAWLAALHEAYANYSARLESLANDSNDIMHPAALAAAIADAVPQDALVTLDGGHTTFWSNDVVSAQNTRQVFHEPGLAQLGFGLPYAIALKRAEPDRTVVNITGDGAFGFSAMELDTARRYGAAVVTFVHNNASWGVIEAGQRRQNFSLGTDLSGTDYAALAIGLGCFGERVERPEDIAPAYARAVASGLPAVIDCKTRFVPHPMMPVFGATNMVGMAP